MSTPTQTTPRIAAAEWLAIGGVVAFSGAFLLSPEHIEDGPVICPFRNITGLPCPGCGLTRSWVYLAHGWWRESFLANPFGLVAVAVVLALVVLAVRARYAGAGPPDLNRLVRRPLVVAVLAAWGVFAILRMVLVGG